MNLAATAFGAAGIITELARPTIRGDLGFFREPADKISSGRS